MIVPPSSDSWTSSARGTRQAQRLPPRTLPSRALPIARTTPLPFTETGGPSLGPNGFPIAWSCSLLAVLLVRSGQGPIQISGPGALHRPKRASSVAGPFSGLRRGPGCPAVPPGAPRGRAGSPSSADELEPAHRGPGRPRRTRDWGRCVPRLFPFGSLRPPARRPEPPPPRDGPGPEEGLVLSFRISRRGRRPAAGALLFDGDAHLCPEGRGVTHERPQLQILRPA